MGANVFSRLQTQRDAAGYFSQVRGSPSTQYDGAGHTRIP
jgi:hypothetical protein